MNENLDLTLYLDATELVKAATDQALELIFSQLIAKGFCHIALTGGVLGGEFATALVAKINEGSDLTGLNIWFSDERFCEADSDLRNSNPVRTGLRNPSVIAHEVMANNVADSVEKAAAAYEAELVLTTMDICVLGLGPDGHIASLFPNLWDESITRKVIAVTNSPKPPAERVSFSMSYINSSLQVWIMAAGAVRATAVSKVLEADLSVPAGHVMGRELTRLFVDSEAFFSE